VRGHGNCCRIHGIPWGGTREDLRPRYQVVKRLWVESWRSAFRVPAHADTGAAVAELQAEAARVGANALLNLVCIPDSGWQLRKQPSVFCYALAIRLR
jgi:hypothetical protein